MMLSTHFSLEELVASEVATRRDLDNTPPNEVMPDLSRLAVGLELVRAALGNHTIHVTSGYHSPRLNQMIGGAKNSMHTLGLAADILCPAFGPPPPGLPRHRKVRHPDRSSHSRVRQVVPRRLRARRAGRPERTTRHRQCRYRLRAGFAQCVRSPNAAGRAPAIFGWNHVETSGELNTDDR